ncbi:MAG: PilZ domain-containing protein [Magnetococcales bacterium]|nr:PilZ domain-containing protein [Magnetococcales bacterium]
MKSALFLPDGFLFNVPVADLSSGGLRLDIPLIDRRFFGQDGMLRLYFQPSIGPNVRQAADNPPYVLEVPCRLVWASDTGVGIEFVDPDPGTRVTIGSLVQRNATA